MNILVVDDSRAIHAFITGLFATTAHALKHVFDGQQAVLCVGDRNNSFDVILLDWEMPVLSGIDALKEIRALGIACPIIMVTTKNEPESIALALERGATDFVMKPFTKDILFGKLSDICGMEVA